MILEGFVHLDDIRMVLEQASSLELIVDCCHSCESSVTYHRFQGLELILEHFNFIDTHEVLILVYFYRTCFFVLG